MPPGSLPIQVGKGPWDLSARKSWYLVTAISVSNKVICFWSRSLVSTATIHESVAGSLLVWWRITSQTLLNSRQSVLKKRSIFLNSKKTRWTTSNQGGGKFRAFMQRGEKVGINKKGQCFLSLSVSHLPRVGSLTPSEMNTDKLKRV